jgi:hypothetical protein
VTGKKSGTSDRPLSAVSSEMSPVEKYKVLATAIEICISGTIPWEIIDSRRLTTLDMHKSRSSRRKRRKSNERDKRRERRKTSAYRSLALQTAQASARDLNEGR